MNMVQLYFYFCHLRRQLPKSLFDVGLVITSNLSMFNVRCTIDFGQDIILVYLMVAVTLTVFSNSVSLMDTLLFVAYIFTNVTGLLVGESCLTLIQDMLQ